MSIKYCLLAHQKETDNYTIASTEGTVIACGEAYINSLRAQELFINFNEFAQGLLAQEEHSGNVLFGRITTERWERKIIGVLDDARYYLGSPPKEELEFFSIPESIVRELHWTPK